MTDKRRLLPALQDMLDESHSSGNMAQDLRDLLISVYPDVENVMRFASQPATLANDATPSVENIMLAKTGGTTTITDFDDGVVGQTFTLLSAHAVTITDGTNILLNGSANFVMAAGDSLTLTMFNDQVWEEVARKVLLSPAFPTHFEIKDDFLYTTFDETDNWISFEGSGATAAAVVVAPEGKIDMISGGVGDANDGVVLSRILTQKGALVSDGRIIFECRVSMDQQLGTNLCWGLSDKLCTDAERNMYKVNSGTVSDGGLTLTDAICWAFDTDATANNKLQFVVEKNGTINIAAAEDADSVGYINDSYITLRIEVDPDGAARWYRDGVLAKSKAAALRATSVLIPFIGANSADNADIATVMSIDYIYFAGHRPATN